LLLAREAIGLGRTPEAVQALRDALAVSFERVRIPGDRAPLAAARFSPREDRILTVGIGSVARLWDADGKPVAKLPGGLMPAPAVFSPRGDLILASFSWRNARLWTLDGRAVATLVGHTNLVTDVAFSPSGDRCATGSADGTVRVWDLAGTTLAVLHGNEAGVRSVAFAGPDRVLSVGADGRVRLFALDGSPPTLVGSAGFPVSVAVASPRGDRIVAAGSDCCPVISDADGRPLARLVGHESWIRHVEFDPSGARIATGSEDGTARLWDAGGAVQAVCRGHLAAVTWVSFAPAGDLVVTASLDGTVRLWDGAGREVAVLRGHSQGVASAVFSRAGDRVLSASADRTARIWDVVPPDPVRFGDRRKGVVAASFSPKGDGVLAVADDGAARAWDTAGNPGSSWGEAATASSGAFSPLADTLLVGTPQGTARWASSDGRELATLRGHEGSVLSVAFLPSPDGTTPMRLLTSSHDGTGRVWDAEGRNLAVLRGHRSDVRSIAGSAQGDRIATASDDGTARVWDVEGRVLALLPGHERKLAAVAFSPDGRLIATGGEDRYARLWEMTGAEVAVLRGHAATVNGITFSSHGDRVITASEDGTARLWDLAGRPLDVLQHGGPVEGAAVAPDGRSILTYGRTMGCALWRARIDDLLLLADARILRDFTRADRTEHRDLLGPSNDLALQAHDRVEALFRDLVVAVAVREAVAQDATISEDMRREALRIVAARTDDLDLLNREAWSIVRLTDRDRYEYDRALVIARAVTRAAPDNWDWLNTLGVAQYRFGGFEDAVRTLEKAEALRARAGVGPAAEDLAVLAMAHKRAGRAEDAQRALVALRTLLETPEFRHDVGARRFLTEAEAVVGTPQEPPTVR
jgi:WD40 repeat protein